MRLRDFVRAHRAEIDAVIRACRPKGFGFPTYINDGERADYVRNVESLYQQAKREGVKQP